MLYILFLFQILGFYLKLCVEHIFSFSSLFHRFWNVTMKGLHVVLVWQWLTADPRTGVCVCVCMRLLLVCIKMVSHIPPSHFQPLKHTHSSIAACVKFSKGKASCWKLSVKPRSELVWNTLWYLSVILSPLSWTQLYTHSLSWHRISTLSTLQSNCCCQHNQ